QATRPANATRSSRSEEAALSPERDQENIRTGARSVKPRELIVLRGEERYPYSAGAVVEALQSAGVPTEDAMDYSRDVERKLRHRGAKAIELEELRALIAEEVRRGVSDEAAKRFLKQ